MEDISLHILDIAENSINADATSIRINIIEKTAEDLFSVEIRDNGRGIPEDLIKNVSDPFYTTRTTRRVGLGLSLFAQAARDTGGDLTIESGTDKGTTVKAIFKPRHIDMKPMGKIADTLMALIAGRPDIDFFFSYEKNNAAFSFDTQSLRAELEGVSLNTPSVLAFIRDYIGKSLADISNKVV
jgi:anti-sigma regulatory factor (Ser/Thr protein kinase)